MKRRSLIQHLETRICLHAEFDVTFNFQPRTSTVPVGTIADLGFAYGDRGQGMNYGWNVDNRGNMRDRNKVSDKKLDTLAQMQDGGTYFWELEIPNGEYQVTIGSGDPRYPEGEHHITAEGTMVMYGATSARKPNVKGSKTITVTDGRLTLRPGPQGVATKIQYVRVQSHHDTPHEQLPYVSISAPIPLAKEGGPDGAFRITRSIVTSSPLQVSVAWSGSGGTTRDLVSTPTLITIPANQASVDVPVVAIDDTLEEALETAKLTLQGSTQYHVSSPKSASVLIDGSEPPVQPSNPTVSVTVVNGTATEGGSPGSLLFTRTNENVSSSLVINLTWTGSAGASDIDYRPSSITFPSNVTQVGLTVTATDDAIAESTETAIVTINSSANYNVSSSSGSGSISIIDNDQGSSGTFTNITWAATTAPPISFSESTSSVVDGKIYLFGGFNSVFVPQSNVYRFDGTNWQTLNNSPVAFTHVGHAEVGTNIWFAGGYIGNGSGGQIFGTTDVRIYNTLNDTWSMGPPLPQARGSGNLIKIDQKLYFFGGESFNHAQDTTDMWVLDLDNQGAGWQTRASMPFARNHASAIAVNNKIYVLGGQTGYDDGLTAHKTIQIYDPSTNAWSVPHMELPGPRSHTVHSTVYYGNRIIMMTGESAHNAAESTIWSINPDTLFIEALNAFPDARFSMATGIINNKIYAFGGYRGFIPTTSYVGTFVW